MKRCVSEFNAEHDTLEPNWRQKLGGGYPADALIAAAEDGLNKFLGDSAHDEKKAEDTKEDLQCQQCCSILHKPCTLITGECCCLRCAPRMPKPKGTEALHFGEKPNTLLDTIAKGADLQSLFNTAKTFII